MKETATKIPIGRAILLIFLSLLLISGSAGIATFFYLRYVEAKSSDQRYNIAAIVQTCTSRDRLPTACLAELLHLSVDRPANLFRLSIPVATESLLAFAPINRATVTKVSPGTIYIDYSMRNPIAYLADYGNTAMDAERVLFPFKPYYTPKNIVKFRLGLSERPQTEIWGTVLKGKRLRLALDLHQILNEQIDLKHLKASEIDVSRAFAKNEGEREIVVILDGHGRACTKDACKNQNCKCYLRLPVEGYHQQLTNYSILNSKLEQGGETGKYNAVVVDLRIPQLAFYKYF